jgi:hypothetical protein
MIVGTQRTRGRTLDTDFDSDCRRSRKTLLTETGTESGKMHNMEVIENFETFPEIINAPSSDQRFRSYGH